MTRIPNEFRASGFTLIEALVALVVFAVMATMGYRGLSAVLDARTQLAAESRKWRDLTLFFIRVESDLGAVVNRPIRDTYDQLQASFVGKPDPAGDTDGLFAFTRLGIPGSTGPSLAIQRLTYRLRDGKVEILAWPSPDQAPRVTPKVHTLLENVSDLKVGYLDAASRQWQTRWAPQPSASVLPLAVKLEMTMTSGEKFSRVFAIPPAL